MALRLDFGAYTLRRGQVTLKNITACQISVSNQPKCIYGGIYNIAVHFIIEEPKYFGRSIPNEYTHVHDAGRLGTQEDD